MAPPTMKGHMGRRKGVPQERIPRKAICAREEGESVEVRGDGRGGQGGGVGLLWTGFVGWTG